MHRAHISQLTSNLGEIIMHIPTDDIWNILTDYDNLSSRHKTSGAINNGGRIVGGKLQVYQRGEQSIFGFEFGVRSIFSYMEFLASSRSKILSRLLDFLSIPP